MMEPIHITPQEAFKRLIDGNARFVHGNYTHQHSTPGRLAELREKQSPFAVIIACSDSRVPPEVIFDCGIGDLFVIRTAGNILDDAGLGSVFYAVNHLGCPLIMVLGHESCGGLKAALLPDEDIEREPEAIRALIAKIRANIQDTMNNHAHLIDFMSRAIIENISSTADSLNLVFRNRIDQGTLAVKKGVFSFLTGNIEIH